MKREARSRKISLELSEEEETKKKNDIEKLYGEILEENLTPPDVKARLIETTTLEQKEKYVSIHKNREKSAAWSKTDSDLMNKLKHAKFPDIDLLLELKIRLSTASKSYVEKFLQIEGIAILIDVINNRLNRKLMDEFDAATIYEILLSCKLAMNFSIGMKNFLDCIGSVDTVARCLNFEFKPLALLALEILSVSCYSESSTSLVVKGMKSMASIRGEAPFSSLTDAIMNHDVELKAAVMEFINSIVVGADLETRALLRSHLNAQKLDSHCNEALKQLDAELGAVEPVGGGRPTLRKGISVKKVVNVDKLGSVPLIALKGVRATSMKGADFNVSRFASDSRQSKAKSMANLTETNLPRGGALLVPLVETNWLGQKKFTPVRKWHSLGDEGIRRHVGDKEASAVVTTIPIGQIHDIKVNTMDRDMLKLVSHHQVHVLEIVGEHNQIMTMGFQKEADRDEWIKSIQVFRDQRLVSKSSYSMQRTYLELRDAIRNADRFRKLYNDYTSLAAEEKQFSIDHCGIDVNDINVVYQYLKSELTAQGLESKLLAIFQEFLLIPAQSEGAWNAVARGSHNVVTLVREGKERFDEAFEDKTIPELLREKAEEEGQAYAQMSKLALSAIAKEEEIQRLKTALEQYQPLEPVSPYHRRSVQEDLKGRQLPTAPVDKKANETAEDGSKSRISDAIKEKLLLLFKKEPVVKVLPDIGLTEEELKGLFGPDFSLPTPTDERYGKYVKMKQMLPDGAVKQKMKLDGFTDEEIDAFLDGKPLPPPSSSTPPPPATVAVPSVAAPAAAVTEPPMEDKYTKFDKMKKMLPEGAVRQKMKMEGIPDEDIEAFFDGTLKRGGGAVAAPATAAPVVHERYAKYAKMKTMLQEGAVRQKMKMDNFSDQEIDDFFAGKIPTTTAAPAAAAAAVDPRIEKYEKMKKMLPEGAVRQKMAMDGFSPTEIDDFFAGKLTNNSSSSAAAVPPAPVAPDPRYEKFEKMKKMLPEGAVRQKMAMEGFTQAEIDAFMTGTPLPPTGAAAPAAHHDPKAALKGAVAGALAMKNNKAPEKPKEPARIPKYTQKCKNIFWNKIPESDIKNTIYQSLKQYELNAQIKQEIEEWFAVKSANAQAAKDLATVTTVAVAAAKFHHKPKQVSLLDGKKTQNILIALGKIRRPPEEIRKMILTMDSNVLNQEMTQSLLAILPNAEELSSAKDYPNPEQLDKASLFAYEMTKVPNVVQRLQTHENIFNWFPLATQLHSQLMIFHSACQELQKEQKAMEMIIAIILSIGNYVNDCTKFGDALGIKIDTLLKLPTMKATNETQYGNFLHFLALQLSKQSPQLLKFSESFVAVWAVAELSFSQAMNDLSLLEKQLLRITEDQQKMKEGKNSPFLAPGEVYQQNPFYQRVFQFTKDAQPKMASLQQELKKIETELEKLMNQFGESMKIRNEEDNAKQFFTIITTFIRQLLKAHDENVKKEQAKIRKAKIAKENAEREAKRLAAKQARLSASSTASSASGNGITRGDSNLSDVDDGKKAEPVDPVMKDPHHHAGNELPEDNIFKDFFNRRSQSIEKTRNEFRVKLQKSVRFSGKIDLSEDDEEDTGAAGESKSSKEAGPFLGQLSPHGSRKSHRNDFRPKSEAITEGDEEED